MTSAQGNSGQVVEVLMAYGPKASLSRVPFLSPLTYSAGECIGDHTRPKHDCCCRYLRFLTSALAWWQDCLAPMLQFRLCP